MTDCSHVPTHACYAFGCRAIRISVLMIGLIYPSLVCTLYSFVCWLLIWKLCSVFDEYLEVMLIQIIFHLDIVVLKFVVLGRIILLLFTRVNAYVVFIFQVTDAIHYAFLVHSNLIFAIHQWSLKLLVLFRYYFFFGRWSSLYDLLDLKFHQCVNCFSLSS